MLQPSENFNADQIRFLQNEASEWIRHANEKIIEAANNGQNDARVNITTNNELGNKFYKGAFALLEHFKARGFICEVSGQSYVNIKW